MTTDGGDVVGGALARAAARAQRLAELDTAHFTIEKLLNYSIPLESLPWGDVLSSACNSAISHSFANLFIPKAFTYCGKTNILLANGSLKTPSSQMSD